MVVDAMVSQTGGWADDVLDYFIESGDTDKVQFRAEKAKIALA
jgi:phage gp46-like protein